MYPSIVSLLVSLKYSVPFALWWYSRGINNVFCVDRSNYGYAAVSSLKHISRTQEESFSSVEQRATEKGFKRYRRAYVRANAMVIVTPSFSEVHFRSGGVGRASMATLGEKGKIYICKI